MKLFDQNITLLQKSLDFRARRNTVLSSNIANLETPGFKAKDLVFEKALGQAMKAGQPGPLNTTNARHMDGRPPTPLSLVQAEVITTANPVGNVDGNTVDMEREMSKLAENQLAYNAATQMISGKFSKLKLVIREGE